MEAEKRYRNKRANVSFVIKPTNITRKTSKNRHGLQKPFIAIKCGTYLQQQPQYWASI
jgi:hypothetical protein